MVLLAPHCKIFAGRKVVKRRFFPKNSPQISKPRPLHPHSKRSRSTQPVSHRRTWSIHLSSQCHINKPGLFTYLASVTKTTLQVGHATSPKIHLTRSAVSRSVSNLGCSNLWNCGLEECLVEEGAQPHVNCLREQQASHCRFSVARYPAVVCTTMPPA